MGDLGQGKYWLGVGELDKGGSGYMALVGLHMKSMLSGKLFAVLRISYPMN